MNEIKPTYERRYERTAAFIRAGRIKAGAVQITAGIEANPNTDFSPEDEVEFAIKLATLIEDYLIPEKEASDES